MIGFSFCRGPSFWQAVTGIDLKLCFVGKSVFCGLVISNTAYGIAEHLVISLDFSSQYIETQDRFELFLKNAVQRHGLEFEGNEARL